MSPQAYSAVVGKWPHRYSGLLGKLRNPKRRENSSSVSVLLGCWPSSAGSPPKSFTQVEEIPSQEQMCAPGPLLHTGQKASGLSALGLPQTSGKRQSPLPVLPPSLLVIPKPQLCLSVPTGVREPIFTNPSPALPQWLLLDGSPSSRAKKEDRGRKQAKTAFMLQPNTQQQ